MLIAGGGLAGLTSSIILARAGYKVLLLEKNQYPRHKVCGEYISNEIRPLLLALGLYPEDLNPVSISRFQISGVGMDAVETSLSMGGFGISRYALDQFLYNKALEAGVEVKTNTSVTSIEFLETHFEVQSFQHKYTAKLVIGAHGKRSSIDKNLQRSFISNTSDFIGVKQHYNAEYPSDLVSLHNFEGGYAGLSMVENRTINMCLLTRKEEFNRYKNLQDFINYHLTQNKNLKVFLDHAKPVFDKPLVISQVNFDHKSVVEDHVLMCGDSAGLIHPLCGNGMAMAIHAAALCSVSVDSFLQAKISRGEMESQYQNDWHSNFNRRLGFGRYTSKLFGRNQVTSLSLTLAKTFPRVFRKLVALSHGTSVEPQILNDV